MISPYDIIAYLTTKKKTAENAKSPMFLYQKNIDPIQEKENILI